jgi:hypothetical protein
VYARRFEPSLEAQESPSKPDKALNSDSSSRVLAVLVAKFVPTVRRLLNFFRRHVTEPTKPENVDDLEEVAGRRTDGLSACSACFEMLQEPFAFPCQGC